MTNPLPVESLSWALAARYPNKQCGYYGPEAWLSAQTGQATPETVCFVYWATFAQRRRRNRTRPTYVSAMCRQRSCVNVLLTTDASSTTDWSEYTSSMCLVRRVWTTSGQSRALFSLLLLLPDHSPPFSPARLLGCNRSKKRELLCRGAAVWLRSVPPILLFTVTLTFLRCSDRLHPC